MRLNHFFFKSKILGYNFEKKVEKTSHLAINGFHAK